MTESELKSYIKLHFPKENERCEWKEWGSLKHSFSGREGDDAISYISAIANRQGGYLIIGVQDKTLEIIGIADFAGRTKENACLSLICLCTNLSDVGLQVEEYKTSDTHKRIWIIHIPKHSARKPVVAHKKAWQRIEDSIVPLTSAREQDILNEPLFKIHDWSAVICPDATIEDLDEKALAKALENYKSKFPEHAIEMANWDTQTFLNKCKLTIKGKITRTAVLLLGKPEAEHFINPAEAKIRWILKDREGNEIDYQIFTCPLLLAVDEVYPKIRNLKYRYMKEGTLFPDEILKYEPYSIRESLNNCIAHQDYELCGRINIVEFDDTLVFRNVGSFIPGSVKNVIEINAPEEQYRNPYLVSAMFNLKMVDTIGSGIRKIFTYQRQRFFPMPDYDLSNNKVQVSIIGKVLDLKYAMVLVQHPELTLEQIILLDKVQKKQTDKLTTSELAYLKNKGLIEGRKPNYIIAEKVAMKTKQIGSYLKNRGFDKKYYKKLLFEFIEKNQEGVDKKEIRELLWDKLPDVLEAGQKEHRISYILRELKREKLITNIGSDAKPCWKSMH